MRGKVAKYLRKKAGVTDIHKERKYIRLFRTHIVCVDEDIQRYKRAKRFYKDPEKRWIVI